MSAGAMLSRSFRCITSFRRYAINRTPSINPSIPATTRSFVRFARDSFDEIEDRDLRNLPVSERGLTREEFEALSEEEQDEIIAREEEMMEEEEDDEHRSAALTQEEIDSLSEQDRKLYLELTESGELRPDEIRLYQEEEQDEDDVHEDDEEIDVDEEHDEDDEIDIEFGEGDDSVGQIHPMDLRQMDPEIAELEERFAVNRKFGLTNMIDQFEQILDDRELDERVRDPEDVRLEDMTIDPSFYAKRTQPAVPRIPGLDYSQDQPIVRPPVVDSRDPNARRNPEPELEPYEVRQERTNNEMLERVIRAGPAVHQSSFIDHQFNTPLIPHWMNMQTANPELIPPKRGANYEDPTSIQYPFIPVLETPQDLNESSLLHRLLQYNRLDATKKFLKLERVRRQLAYQRQYRDLSAYCKKLCAKLPAERVDLKDVQPKVKNLPTHIPAEYLKEMHPHKIPTETSWMHSMMWLVHDNIKDSGKLSQLEKEQYLRTTQRFCSYAYRQMMKDKNTGYYRVMAMPPMADTKEEQDARKTAAAPRIATPTQSSMLRQAKIIIRSSAQQ